MYRVLALGLVVWVAVGCEGGRIIAPPTMTLTPRDAGATTETDASANADAEADMDASELDLDARVDLDATADDANAADAGPRPDVGFRDASAPDAAPADASVAMSGCGRPQMSGLFDGTISVNGRMREVLVSVPAGYDPNRPYALVFGWHGQNWTKDAFRDAHRDLEMASNGDAIVAWPQALMLGGSLSWDLNGNGQDVALYDEMHAYFTSNFCIDTTRVFSFGRSYGAFFTNVLGCVRRSELRGLSAWAGNGPSGNCPGRVSAWVGHAQDDPTVRYTTSTRDSYVRANGCTSMTLPAADAPCVSYVGCQGGTQVTWCSHTRGGHPPPVDYGTRAWNFFGGL